MSVLRFKIFCAFKFDKNYLTLVLLASDFKIVMLLSIFKIEF